MRRISIWLAALAAGAAPAAALAQQGAPYSHGHMWDGGWHGWVFGPLMMLVFLALGVVVVVMVVRVLTGPGSGAPRGGGGREKSPLDILQERYARGEIDKDEYEERRRTLEG